MNANPNRLRENLGQAITVLQKLSLDTEAKTLLAMQNRIDASALRVLLVGEFGRGKTSLLNSFIGSKILAVSPLPTPTFNILRWGESTAARAGTQTILNVVPIESLVGTSYETVELSFPLDMLRNEVQWIELPSVTESADTETVDDYFRTADLVVVALACDALYSSSDNQIVERLKAAGHRDLFFVCNFIDRIPFDEVESIHRSAFVRIPANRDRIFFTSPTKALDGDEEAIATIRKLAVALTEVATSGRDDLKSTRAVRLLRDAVKLARNRANEMETLAASTAAQQQARAKSLNEAYEAVAMAGRQISANLDDFQARTRDVIQSMTAGFIRELSLKVETWVNSYNGSDVNEHVQAQLKQAVQTWYSSELIPYLREQMNRQTIAMDSSIERYRHKLHTLREELPGLSDELQVTLTFDNLPDLRDIGIRTGFNLVTGKNSQSVPWTQMPEVLLIATASLAAIFLLQPLILGLPVGLAGIGLAATIASRRSKRGSDSDLHEAARSAAADIRKQADIVARTVWQNIDSQMETTKLQIEESVRAHTERVRSTVHGELKHQELSIVEPALSPAELSELEAFIISVSSP